MANSGSPRAIRVLAALVLILCMGAAAYLGWLGLSELADRRRGVEYYGQLAEAVHRAGFEAVAVEGEAEAPERDDGVDFIALRAACPDVVGWIRIDGTVIDYPVVRGPDNDFYLHHLPDGTPNDGGSIMMDAACAGDFSCEVTILHGHHMRSGAMFGDLDEYAKADYFAAHPVLRLVTPDGGFDVEIFAAFTVNGASFGYPTGFATDAEFDEFVAAARVRSAFDADVDVSRGDRLLLLSTCAYSFENARFIVLGRIAE